MILPGSTSERAAYLEKLAHTTTPSFDFFLFSIIAGLILGIAVLMDIEPLYVLAALACPFMAPVVGLSLASVFGSFRFFVRTLAGLVVGSGLVFLLGVFTGLTGIVFVTRKNFSFLGPALSIGALVALGLIVCAVLFGLNLGIIFTGAMIALASGYILYGTSNVLHEYRVGQHVAASLALFASVALLFWYLLQLVMYFTGRE